MPPNDPTPCQLLAPQPIHNLDIDCLSLIKALEADLEKQQIIIESGFLGKPLFYGCHPDLFLLTMTG